MYIHPLLLENTNGYLIDISIYVIFTVMLVSETEG